VASSLLHYQVVTGEPITRFLHSDVQLTPVASPNEVMAAQVGMVEGYFDVEYPVRRHFLADRLGKEISYDPPTMSHVYSAFEAEDIDFSAFLSTPYHLACWAETFIEADVAGSYDFEIKTCGGMRVWVNGQLQAAFDPFSRNHPVAQAIQLDLRLGSNRVVVYFDDLAERDTRYLFEIRYLGTSPLRGYLPLPYDAERLLQAERYLAALYPERDIFTSGDIQIVNPTPHQATQWLESLRVRFNPELLATGEEMQDGNITEFKLADRYISAVDPLISLGTVSEFPTAGLTKCEISVLLPNGDYVSRTLPFSIYDKAAFADIITGQSLAERKQQALEYFAALDLDDVNVGLAKIVLGQPLIKDEATGQYQEFATALPLIAVKGDCADFVLAPLLAVLLKYPDRFPLDLRQQIEALALQFRYWIDEPGNDVMWYFSENHALLFHVAQYLAGCLYPDAEFSLSGLSGSEVRQRGYQRLRHWFADFFKYGFAEWNSITYLPIDLIGFFSLYLAAPDDEIRELAARALDVTFEVAAIHLHHGAMSTTYGRVYEHNLKTIPLGEVTNLAKIAWGTGYFNRALRASALFALTDYQPNPNLEPYLHLARDGALTAEYLQGINHALTYQYKTSDYSLSSAINYQADTPGYQQHIMNVSLGNGEGHTTQFWLNNPGERKFSGEGRPSYWAGNGQLPISYQYKNVLLMQYNLDGQIPYLHLYLPHWELSDIRESGNWLFLKKDDAYAGVYFANGYRVTAQGAVAHREVKSEGREHFVVVKCGSKAENGSFESFMTELMETNDIQTGQVFRYYDATYGQFTIQDGKFYLNGQEVNYHRSYEKNVTIEQRALK